MDHSTVKNRFKTAILLTFFILFTEVLGGIWSNSLALLSDAAHLFMDGLALCLSWFALIVSEQPPTKTKTFGNHRIETFAAFLNGLLLLCMACVILFESSKRLWSPQEIESKIVIYVASLGLLVNLLIISFLQKPFKETRDLNIKSSFYHILGDTIASFIVIFGAIIIHFTKWYQVDAFVGLGIGLIILWGTFKIISESLHILLEGVPKGVSYSEVENAIISIPSIESVHKLHIWSICSNIYALSTHALIRDLANDKNQSLLEEIRAVLKNQFNITHATIQLESISCGQAGPLCQIKH